MKLHVLSDLHLGFAGFERPRTEADVVVLAGDIARPREAVAWAMEFDFPVLYVPGNHEFYGGSIEGTLDELKQLCEGTNVHLLDNTELVPGRRSFSRHDALDRFRAVRSQRAQGRGDGRSHAVPARLQPDQTQ